MRAITNYLRNLKEKSGYTVQQIADLTEIPYGTLSHYFSGMDDESCNYVIVSAVIKALHGSMDELSGIRAPETDKSPIPAYDDGIRMLIEEKGDHIRQLRILCEKYRKGIYRIAAIAVCALSLFVIMYIVSELRTQ